MYWRTLALVLALWSVAAGAHADDLDDARALLERAEFAAAIEAFDRAAAGDALDRDALVQVLEGRARAAHAARRTELMEHDLLALLSLEPLYRLDERAPPSLRRALERLRSSVGERIELSVQDAARPGGIVVTAEVSHDPAELVRALRVHVQESDGSFRSVQSESASRRVELEAEGEVRYYAEAIGPGGAVVASAGSRASPRELRVPGSLALVAAPQTDEASSGDDPWPWVGLGIGLGAAAIAAAIILGVVFGGQSEGTQLSPPMEIP